MSFINRRRPRDSLALISSALQVSGDFQSDRKFDADLFNRGEFRRKF